MDWVSGGLGAWGTGTGPQGNRLLWEGRKHVTGKNKSVEGEVWFRVRLTQKKKVHTVTVYLQKKTEQVNKLNENKNVRVII